MSVGTTALIPGDVWVNRTHPSIRMGIVRVEREWRTGDWEGNS